MPIIEFSSGELDSQLQQQLSAGFDHHSQFQQAPSYEKQQLNWMLQDSQGKLIAALTSHLLWDWLYIDELWVDDACRGKGMGKKLMQHAEQYARKEKLAGLWLWTQSWQAPTFYQSLGFVEFSRFDNFPKGHYRIGLRKTLNLID
ncbi:GNAT family N-acetyltransferase [Vibrio hippocampi]|uniref:N-acetyltransferase domain-containing protein n=1 Tax=Vibrio hippocampi TaxID=654686 RepID=A0ABM8ZQ10_9VIBR|nr:GNAT family N-acetyltransferase [Vibrio hippocampi]CAH0530315.1 hypothetical protein VHP8226_03956 [Vibrio hippocampi]